ncbi:MAG: zinc-binding dehydrogenase [Deltaproteobacteria bacterium]|nr:MAG: zinc-binding dehydrogenase [Deltaproteobacteria bacterium]
MTVSEATTHDRVVIHKAGSFDQLRIETHPALQPGPGEVRIDVAASGINYADVIVRMGLYASAKELVGWPITPGFEVSGRVSAIGADVSHVAVGQRVLAVTLFDGYATQVCVPGHQVFALPDDLGFVEAAGLPAVFMTAWMALSFLAHPRPGDTLLVHSAAGGVGSSLVQLAKARGCRVVGVVGGSHKVAVARELGCDVVIDKSTQDLWAQAQAAAPDGYDVVLDANGVSTLSGSYDALRAAGKLVVYGFGSMMPRTAGRPNYARLAVDFLRTPRFNPLNLTNHSKSVLAFNLSYLFDRTDLLAEGMADIMGLLAEGAIRPPPATEYAFADVAQAHRDIQSGTTTGKLVLVIEPAATADPPSS